MADGVAAEMKASKNAHDWHCEDHDTYGWRGEACPLCPKARGEAEMIEQLEAENAGLRRRLAEVDKVLSDVLDAWAARSNGDDA